MSDIIRQPGKFEGEPTFVPYLWDMTLDGLSAETFFDGQTQYDFLVISEADIAKFPSLASVYAVALWESDSGFVYHRTFATKEELDGVLAELEEESEGGDSDEC